MTRSNFRFASEIILIIFGLFLVIDGFLLKGLSFDYSVIGLEFLDPLISHGIIGAIIVIIGIIDFRISR